MEFGEFPDFYYIGGDTYHHKELIKSRGGHWDPSSKRWIFKKEKGFVDFKRQFAIFPVYGDTYIVKDLIKDIGGRYDPMKKLWYVPNDNETLVKLREIMGSTEPARPLDSAESVRPLSPVRPLGSAELASLSSSVRPLSSVRQLDQSSDPIIRKFSECYPSMETDWNKDMQNPRLEFCRKIGFDKFCYCRKGDLMRTIINEKEDVVKFMTQLYPQEYMRYHDTDFVRRRYNPNRRIGRITHSFDPTFCPKVHALCDYCRLICCDKAIVKTEGGGLYFSCVEHGITNVYSD